MATSADSPWKKPALRLMAEAERLIGEQGYDNVSLVEIARSAGQGNKYAVQYHFGNKENLVRAIFDDRLERIGARRRELLDGIKAEGAVTVRNLLHAFIHPVYLEVDERGLHAYARFAERMLDTPLAGDVWFSSSNFATATEVRELLASITSLEPRDFAIRYSLVSALLIQALHTIDRAARGAAHQPEGKSLPGSAAEILETAISIACGALQNTGQARN